MLSFVFFFSYFFISFFFFFFNDTATTEIYTLSLHDALPILHIIHAGVFWLAVPVLWAATAPAGIICRGGAAHHAGAAGVPNARISVRANRHPYPGWRDVAYQSIFGRQFTRALMPSAEPAWGRPAPAGTHCEPGRDSTRGCPGQAGDPGRTQASSPSCTRGDATDAHHH